MCAVAKANAAACGLSTTGGILDFSSGFSLYTTRMRWRTHTKATRNTQGPDQGRVENEEKDMKKIVKTKPVRNLFGELREGMTALAESRQGKRTLRTHVVQYKPIPKVTPQELIRVRERLKCSRALFAGYLRTNVRTLENWEQGRAKPNAQAVLLIHLVKRYPDTVERLASI
jgi:putative transcriptional regulator